MLLAVFGAAIAYWLARAVMKRTLPESRLTSSLFGPGRHQNRPALGPATVIIAIDLGVASLAVDDLGFRVLPAFVSLAAIHVAVIYTAARVQLHRHDTLWLMRDATGVKYDDLALITFSIAAGSSFGLWVHYLAEDVWSAVVFWGMASIFMYGVFFVGSFWRHREWGPKYRSRGVSRRSESRGDRR